MIHNNILINCIFIFYIISAKPSGGKLILPVVKALKGCLYNEVRFSKGMSYYVLDCKGPGIPRVLLFKTATNKQITVLNNNTPLRQKVLNMSLPNVRIIDVPLTKSKFESSQYSSSESSNTAMNDAHLSEYNATVKLYLPPEITVETFTSFPLIVEV